MRTQPQAQPTIQTQKGTKDYQQYLAELDQLLKRNTGTGLFTAEDATSNTPMYLPGQVRNASGIEENAAAVSAQPRASVVPEYQQPQYQEEQQQDEQQGQVLGAESGNMTVQDFVDQFTQAVHSPQRATTEQLQDSYLRSGQKYGIQSMADGRIKYNDGSIGIQEEKEPNAIASMQDGSILWDDGFTRQAPPQNMQGQLAGVNGLSKFLFGRNQTVTQPYGNVNPIEPTPGNVNYGTDFRTRDLEQRNLKLPVDTKVVQILRDDGTRFGSISGHKGYGNSILLELPSGERVRMSHLSNLPDFQQGETITAGTVFGTPGATGNTYGEHLDVEYYDQNGQISSPDKFLANAGQTYSAESKITGVSPYLQRPNMSVDPRNLESRQTAQQNPQSQQSTDTQQFSSYGNPQYSMIDDRSSAANGFSYNPGQAIQKFGQDVKQLPSNIGKSIDESTAINQATDGKGLGISELLQGNTQGAGREVSNTIEKINPTPRIDTGISELLRGDVAGAKQNFSNTAQRVTNRVERLPGQVLGAVAPKAYADDGDLRQLIESLGQNIKGAASSAGDYLNEKTDEAQDVVRQAGQGVRDLGKAGIDALGAVFKPKQEATPRAVGDVAGTADPGSASQFSSLMDGAPSMSTLVKNDVSDPFFKMGGSEMYKGFLKPNAKDLFGGALNMDMFTPDFYKDLGNISSVFGGSKDLGAATEKYVANERAKYPTMSRMNWEEGYDRGEIDNYNRQVDEYNNSINNYLNEVRSSTNGAKSIFTPVQSSRQNIFAKPAAQMSMSQSTAPRMSGAPSISKPQMSMARPSSAPQMSSVSRVSAPQMSSAPKASPAAASSAKLSAPSPAKSNPVAQATAFAKSFQSMPAVKAAPAPKIAQSFTPSKPAAASASIKKSPAPQSKPSSNVFSKVTSAIKSIFRR